MNKTEMENSISKDWIKSIHLNGKTIDVICMATINIVNYTESFNNLLEETKFTGKCYYTDVNFGSWYKDGKLHNTEGPAVVLEYNGHREWWLDGVLYGKDSAVGRRQPENRLVREAIVLDKKEDETYGFFGYKLLPENMASIRPKIPGLLIF